MTIDVTTSAGIIDQRGMTAGERFEVACIVREGWWDCYGVFMEDSVDLTELGLSPRSLEALADDLEEAGYLWHAGAARAAARPTVPSVYGQDRAHWRGRVHRTVRATARR